MALKATQARKVARQQIAAGVVAGKSKKQIAAEIGYQADSVGQILKHDPELRSLLVRLKDRHAAQIDKLYRAMLESLATDLADRDADVRFRARQEVLRLAALGETKPDGTPDDVAGEVVAGEIDLEHALAQWRRSNQTPRVIEAEATPSG